MASAQTKDLQPFLDDEDLQADLPEQAAEVLATLTPDETHLATVYSDMTLSGHYGDRWLVVTDQRLVTLAQEEGSAWLELDLPLADIRRVRLRNSVGGGVLEVVTDDAALELVRFSRSVAAQVSRAYHLLRQLAGSEEDGQDRSTPSASKAKRCETCGRAVPVWSEVCSFCIQRRQLLLRLVGYLGPHKAVAITGFALSIVLTVVGLLPAYLTRYLFDQVLAPRWPPGLAIVVIWMLVIEVAYAGISMVRGYMMQWLGSRVVFDMRTQLFDHLQLLSLGFFSRRQTGQIMSRVTNDIMQLQFFISDGLQQILINLLTIPIVCIMLFQANATLAALALLPTPFIVLGTVWFGRLIHVVYHKLWRRWSGMNAALTDAIPGIRVVKSFVQESRESKRFREHSTALFLQELNAARLWTTFFPALGLMTAVGFLVVEGMGGLQVLHNLTSAGTLVMFTQLLWSFYYPVQNLGEMNHQVQHALTAAERVFEVLDTSPELADAPGSITLPHITGRVEFRSVSFSYEPGRPILTDISFVAEPGEVIGLVGPSGAGKSTLVQLLSRFYEAESGQVLIDGIDVRQLALRPLRQQIGVVLQEPFLFHGTVAENIAYGRPDAGAEEIVAAAKMANAHDFIVNLPHGYDTLTGERGQLMSGGERQRVSIARAILRNPPILILDEATSSVDTETEMLIQQALERLVENRTTFAIAHRLSTLRRASKIMVLERGRVVELGTHDELLDGDGLYSRLCKLQSELSRVTVW
jgi:ATP-binding cassette subfamily B protein